jgi:hypothetical protein
MISNGYAAYDVSGWPRIETESELAAILGIDDTDKHTFEKGAEFEQDILIKGGKIVKDEIIEYDNYQFESALPMLGG